MDLGFQGLRLLGLIGFTRFGVCLGIGAWGVFGVGILIRVSGLWFVKDLGFGICLGLGIC